MKVLLTGAYGQLGTEFRKLFEKMKIDYIPISRIKRDEKTFVADISNDSKKLEMLFVKEKIGLVVNCAAYNNVDEAESKGYEEAWRVNTLAVANLSSLCAKYNVPIIHYSTDYVFNGTKRNPYTEDDKPIPICRYGITKLGGEDFLRYTWADYICLRVSWVFGKGETNFIRKLLRWSEGGSVRISTDEVSSPTYTATIASVSWKLFEQRAYGLYHLSSEGECSRYEYAKFVLETLGWKGKIIETEQAYFNLPAKRPSYSKLDTSKVKKTLNIELPHWKEAVYTYLKDEGMI